MRTHEADDDLVRTQPAPPPAARPPYHPPHLKVVGTVVAGTELGGSL
jgi:hypothetical protein